MPTYEYLCHACGHRFEIFQSILSEPERICPVCKKKAVTRLLTGGSGLIFKGSGFYSTDYKNTKAKESPPDKADVKEDVKPASTDVKKSDD